MLWYPATLGCSASLWILVADKSQSRSNLFSFVGTDQCDRYGVRHSTVTLLDRRPASQLRATCSSRLFIKPASPARSAFFQQLGVTPLLVVEGVVAGQVPVPMCASGDDYDDVMELIGQQRVNVSGHQMVPPVAELRLQSEV